jgi:hypothetical protein
MDDTIRDLLASVAKAAADEGTRDSSSDHAAFQHYIEAVVNLGHFGQEWTSSENSIPGDRSAYAHLWAERSTDLDKHLCEVLKNHVLAVSSFTEALANTLEPKA